MPRAARPLPKTAPEGAAAVYLPSCLTRMMGALPGEPEGPSLPEAVVAVADRAGVPVFIPEDVAGTCCGVPFSSKGYDEAHAVALNRAVERMWTWSDAGSLPVVIDASPCAYGLLNADGALTEENRKKRRALTILDAVAFAHDVLLPRLSITAREMSAVVHPVCSLVKMGLAPKLEAVARACADGVVVPPDAGCCGFAGDRGFLLPELTESATRAEAAGVPPGAAGHWSSSRTCEIGLTRATGATYRSFLILLERATRPS
jgi:D-lactate dehydrogenase